MEEISTSVHQPAAFLEFHNIGRLVLVRKLPVNGLKDINRRDQTFILTKLVWPQYELQTSFLQRIHKTQHADGLVNNDRIPQAGLTYRIVLDEVCYQVLGPPHANHIVQRTATHREETM